MDQDKDLSQIQEEIHPTNLLSNTFRAFNTLPLEQKDEMIAQYGEVRGFCRSLIRSVLIRRYRDKDVFISARKSMTLRVYLHSKSKRAKTLALLDSGATENFMSLDYTKHLHLLIKTLQEPRRLFNVDGTLNKAGNLKYYTDLGTRTGTSTRTLRYFLSDLGDSRVILGYPWFAAAQPKIDWARGWISHDQLPIVLRSVDAAKAQF